MLWYYVADRTTVFPQGIKVRSYGTLLALQCRSENPLRGQLYLKQLQLPPCARHHDGGGSRLQTTSATAEVGNGESCI